jgi:mono/diheme cytochrome c family protein
LEILALVPGGARMKKVLKWVAIVIGAIIGLIVVALAAVYIISGIRIGKSYDDVAVEAKVLPAGDEAIARGRHLVEISCTDCHGEDLAGEAMVEDPIVATLFGSNLTSGEGGVAGDNTDGELVRAIRQGIGADGKSLWFMPSQEFNHWSDADVGAIVAYLRQVPPVNNQQPENSGGPLGRILFLTGMLPLLPAELVDHEAVRPPAPPIGVSVEYGAYLGRGCNGCHGPELAGGPIPGTPPGSTIAANLTPAGALANWSEAEFIETMRGGTTPDGRVLDSEWMPWPTLARMTDDELMAIWLYLQSVPAALTDG